MTASTASGPRKVVRRPLVVVAGNPNTGKTTVFNRLTGSDQKVANYPGVTVERHTANLELANGVVAEVLDVPGAYSLSARSREEELAIQTIAGLPPFEVPDLVVVVADATQLSRNLYMTLQVLELGVPVVLVPADSDQLEVVAVGIRKDLVFHLGVAKMLSRIVFKKRDKQFLIVLYFFFYCCHDTIVSVSF